MGQAGSLEQRNAIRDVIALKPASDAPAAITAALEAFRRTFPAPVIPATNNTGDDPAPLELKETKLFLAMHQLLQHLTTERSEREAHDEMIGLTLTCLKRVIGWRELYRLGAKCAMKPLLNCLMLSPAIEQSGLEVLLALTGCCPGNETNEKTDKWELLNRRNFGDSGGYEVLRSLLVKHSATTTSPSETESSLRLVLELFHMALVTRKSTTDSATNAQAVGALLNARNPILDLCHHADREIQEFAIDLVKELFFLIDLEQVHELQESAREYGALLYALREALSVGEEDLDGGDKSEAETNDGNLTPTNSKHMLRSKSVELVELFCAGNTRSKKAICRMFPVELFIPAENRSDLLARHTASSILKNTRANRSMPTFSFDFDLRSTTDSKRSRMTSQTGNGKLQGGVGAFERWLNDARSQGEHWLNIIDSVLQTHERPELVWRSSMREELSLALTREVEAFENQKRSSYQESMTTSAMKWDHEMFYVDYRSIQDELVVNGYFVEFLIPVLADLTNSFEVVDPVILAWHLSDRLATERNESWKLLCIRCLRLLVRRYAMILQGQLPIQNVLTLLANHSIYSAEFIRECFLLLSTAIITTRNAPSESLNRQSLLVTASVVDVLSDPVLIGSLSRCKIGGSTDAINRGNGVGPSTLDFDEEDVEIRNSSDGLVRAGVNVLQAIIRRARFALILVRPKRVFICRLLAVETLDPVTVGRILVILKQLSQLDVNSVTTASVTHTLVRPNSKPAVDANWKSLALVYLMVACCDPKGRGMPLAAAEFLKENYAMPQNPSSSCASPTSQHEIVKTHNSAKDKNARSEFNELLSEAVGYNGCGIGSLLSSTDPAQFCAVFNAELKRSADVMWGRHQRTKVFKHLKQKFVSSGNSSNQQEELDFGSHDEKADVDNDIFVGNIFLRSFIEGDGQFLNVWTPEMYKNLINALFFKLVDLSRTKSVFGMSGNSVKSANSEPWEVQVLILKALIKVIPTHCAAVEVQPEFYDTSFLPLRRSLLGDTDQIRGVLALELLIAILGVPDDRSSNADSCCLFLEKRGLGLIAEALDKMLASSYQQMLAKSGGDQKSLAHDLLCRVMDLLTTLVVHPKGPQAITSNPPVITSLLDMSSKDMISRYSPGAACASLSCLAKLCHYDGPRNVVVQAGGLLALIDVCAFGQSYMRPNASEQRTPENLDDAINSRGDDSVRDQSSTYSEDPIREAAVTLRVCLNENVSETSSVHQVLKQLLSPSFLRVLRSSPEKFNARLRSLADINSPTLIWTQKMRSKLSSTLESELNRVRTAAKAQVWPRWNPDHFIAADSFRYQYPELTDELIVHDVYINNFVATDGVALEDIDMSAFSQALLISIQSSENVLRILQQRGTNDPRRERGIVVMRLALNKLVSTHPQHNLEVSPAPPTTSLIENESSDDGSEEDDDLSLRASIVEVNNGERKLDRMSSMDLEDLTV